MAQLVVVEEREQSRVAKLLTGEGLLVDTTAGSTDLLTKVVEHAEPDLVLLEVAAVSRAVIRLCASLQTVTSAPIVIFCEHASEREVVAAYSAGVQAVICEPVGSYELVARVRALLRRAPVRAEAPPDVLVVGPVVLDRGRRQITVNGELIAVPRKEFDIAELLMCKAGTVVPRSQLVRELWGAARDTKTLDVQVGRLRSKLTAAEGRQRIVTVRGLGYRFVTDDDLDAAAQDASSSARPSSV